MKTKVELDPQVVGLVRSLAPDPRKRMRAALRELEREKGDLKQLDAELAAYTRLRVGPFRVILRFYSVRGQRIIRCVYAERRSVVYELFSQLLRSGNLNV